MPILLLWLPWLFRGISVLSALAGLFQGQQVLSGGYSASPWNLGMVATWLGTSAGSWVVSWLVKPTSWESIKVWLDKIFDYVQAKAGIDPKNQTDLDERTRALIEEYLLRLLSLLVSRWSPDAQVKGQALIADLQHCRGVANYGTPSPETVAAMAGPAKKPMA